jgi:hypothetical protein
LLLQTFDLSVYQIEAFLGFLGFISQVCTKRFEVQVQFLNPLHDFLKILVQISHIYFHFVDLITQNSQIILLSSIYHSVIELSELFTNFSKINARNLFVDLVKFNFENRDPVIRFFLFFFLFFGPLHDGVYLLLQLLVIPLAVAYGCLVFHLIF